MNTKPKEKLFDIQRTRQLMDKLKKGNSRQERSAVIDLAESQIHTLANAQPRFLTNAEGQKIINEQQQRITELEAEAIKQGFQLSRALDSAAKNKKPTAQKTKPGASSPTITRESFRNLTPTKKSAHLKGGGKLSD